MPTIIAKKGFTFADVLIEPQYSAIETRTSINVLSKYLGGWRVPIVSAPMDYVTGYEMAQEMYNLGAYGIVNRFDSAQEDIPDAAEYGIAVGVKDIDRTLQRIESEKPHSVCIDVAHGHHKNVALAIQEIRNAFESIYIMAGNIATPDGLMFLSENGVDAVRVGIGPGSACSTRENTGVGVPQLSAIMRVAETKRDWGYDTSIIADGGIQTPGDIVKALAGGADAVMLGQMLAGHKENPGHILGHQLQPYRGQSIFGSNAKRGAPEGVEGWVAAKGAVADTIESLINYIRSGMSYVGANNIAELRAKAVFIEVSPGTFKESETRI